MGKEASLTFPSTYQDFWDTSEAMVVSPYATAYRLPCQEAPIFWALAENGAGSFLLFRRRVMCRRQTDGQEMEHDRRWFPL